MAKVEKLNSVEIDVDKCIYKVNGRDISQSGKYFNLTFEGGVWSLMVSEDTLYTTDDRVLDHKEEREVWKK